MLLAGTVLLAGCAGNAGNKQTESSGPETEESSSQAASEPESETDTTSETESEPEPVTSTITISATGDCALGKLQYHGYEGSFVEYYDKKGPDYFFENFKDVFTQDDLTLVNLECVFTDETERVEKTFNIKGLPEYTAILTGSGVEACALGNNHSRDYGIRSLYDTQKALDDADVLYAYNDIVSYYTNEDGVKVAMVSASALSGDGDNVHYLFEGIQSAKENGANLIVLSLHWGIEKQTYPTEAQKTLAHQLIDAGADLIIGNHPHVLQGMEYYNGKMIVYSLGNFSFGANRTPYARDTAVYQQTFTFVDGELQPIFDAGIIPARICGPESMNNYQPIRAEGEQAERIIRDMNAYSEKLGDVTFDEDGKIIIKEK